MASDPVRVYHRLMVPTFTPLSDALLAPLPPIVQRYLRMALPHGIPSSNMVTLQQQGGMRLKEGSSKWLPFTASEQFQVSPPEFVWNARLKMGALMSTTVVDEYRDGIGAINARLWGVIPLVHPAHDPRLDEGALLRYLAEAVWFPVALLPGRQLQWQAVDELSAVALLRDGGVEARLTFHFNSSGEVVHVEGIRPYLSGRKFLSRGWSGLFSEWREFCGMRIPVDGRVFWHLDSGVWEYWRGTIESLTCSHSE